MLVGYGSVIIMGIGFFELLLIIGSMFVITVLISLFYEIIWVVIRGRKVNKKFKGQIDYYEIYSARKKKEEEDSK